MQVSFLETRIADRNRRPLSGGVPELQLNVVDPGLPKTAEEATEGQAFGVGVHPAVQLDFFP